MNVNPSEQEYLMRAMDALSTAIMLVKPRTHGEQVAMAVVLADLCGSALGTILATGDRLLQHAMAMHPNDMKAAEGEAQLAEVQKKLMAMAAQRIAKAAKFGAEVAGDEIDLRMAERRAQ